VMSSALSAVTYTSVYTDFEQWRFYGGSDEEPAYAGSPGVIVYGYDGLLMHPYPEYLLPYRDEAAIKDQALLADASPTALSSCYVADSDLEEDPEEDHADYPANGRDGDDEPSDDENDDDDDDDVDDEDEEASKDEEDDEEEEEHLALVDSSTIPVIDHVPSAGDTKAFKTDEARKTVRPQTPIPFLSEAEVDRLLALPTPPPSPLTLYSSPLPQIPSPPLPISSPLLPLPSSFTTSPTNARAPLGYRAAGIRIRVASPPLLLPSTCHMTDIPEAEMPPQKRACL
ncbi:hypothetical protein Tco_0077572, partial [Tanacetum coccineum]